ncbi:hypothetical protein [Streptomyces sp. NPDC002533]
MPMEIITRLRTQLVALVDALSIGHQLLPRLHDFDVECVHVQSQNPNVDLSGLPHPEYLERLRRLNPRCPVDH